MVCVGRRLTTYQTNHPAIRFFLPKIAYFQNIDIGFPSDNPNDYTEIALIISKASVMLDLVEWAHWRSH